MTSLRLCLARLVGIFRRRRLDRDLTEEITAHLGQLERDHHARGLTSQAARDAARRAFGPVAPMKEAHRDQSGVPFIETLLQDAGSAARTLRRSPAFSIVAIVTFALGIGANTALFSIFSSLTLRPLPVRDPAALALLSDGSWSYPIWEEIRARETELFDGVFAWSAQRFDVAASGPSDLLDGAYVSGRFFEVLGVRAERGRMITDGDDSGAAPDGPVAVISHRLWRQRFSGAEDVVGRRLSVHRVPFTIVGVIPPEFFGPDVGRRMDVLVPFAVEPLIRGQESRLTSRGSWWLQIMARLKPGQSLAQANAALRIDQPHIIAGATRTLSEPLTLVAAETGNSSLRTRFETPLFAMVVAVVLVLLVACANIATVMLARAVGRHRELSVRLALGGSRARIARSLFIESLIVAVIGAALGLLFAWWSSAILVQQLSTWQSTVSLDLALDWRVLAFTAVLACLSAIIAGMAPVLGLRRIPLGETLRDGGRGISGERHLGARGALVVAQIAVSLVLVVGAGLFLRTFASLNQLPLGFVPQPLLVVELNLQAGGGRTEERGARVERLRDAAAAVAGVRSASVAAIRPLTGGGWSSGRAVGVGNEPLPRVDRGQPLVWRNATTPGWFETMGIPFRIGRDFVAADRVGGPLVAIVNETFVRRYLNGQPIGQQVRLSDEGPRYEVVGVVADAVYTTPREGMAATLYVPLAQQAPETFWPTVLLTINVASGRRAVIERDVAAALTHVDPSIAFTFGTFDQLVEATVAQERLIALLSSFFGGLALLLAAVGLYGLVAHGMRARQAEIGLRITLGAAPASILFAAFARVAVLILAGLALGGVGSLWTARLVETLLFHVEADDPLTFVGAAAVLVAVGMLAAWLPARRAIRLDPAAVLREG